MVTIHYVTRYDGGGACIYELHTNDQLAPLITAMGLKKSKIVSINYIIYTQW